MTQEEKDLLIKDLCARLPYGVKCIEKTPIEDFQDKNLWEIDRIRADTFMFGMSNCYVCYGQYDDIHNIKPYLFPISSMTEEQKEEFNTRSLELQLKVINDEIMYEKATEFEVDFYNKHHLDWRGLIPMGLAIDATNLNIY